MSYRFSMFAPEKAKIDYFRHDARTRFRKMNAPEILHQRKTHLFCNVTLLAVLHTRTPLCEVTQDLVAEYVGARENYLLVADTFNGVVREVELNTLLVQTLFGPINKANELGSLAMKFDDPVCVVYDGRTVYVGDATHVRRIANGTMTTLCGNGMGYCEGVGTKAKFRCLSSLLIVGEFLFVSDSSNNVVRRMSLETGETQLFAGTPEETGHVDGVKAMFDSPQGMVADFAGNIFVADTRNHCIRKITPSGVVSTAAGCGQRGHRDGALKEAMFNLPSAIAFCGRSRLLVADYSRFCIRLVDFQAGTVTTLIDGFHEGEKTIVNLPILDLVVDGGMCAYVSCMDHTIRRITPFGEVTTVCGQRTRTGCVDAVGTEAKFHNPVGLTLNDVTVFARE